MDRSTTLETRAASEIEAAQVLCDRLAKYKADYNASGHDEAEKYRILRKLEGEFSSWYPRGTSVVLALDTCEFVVAVKRADALKAFISRYDKRTSGWAFDAGRPVVVGGGVCPS
jgi:hypothetical protein